MKIAQSAVALSSKRQALSLHQSATLSSLRMKKADLEVLSGKKDSKLKKDKNGSKQSRGGSDLRQRDGGEPAVRVKISDRGREFLKGMDERTAEAVSGQREQGGYDPSEITMQTLRMLIRMLRTLGGSDEAIKRLEEAIDRQAELSRQKHNAACIEPLSLSGAVSLAGKSGEKGEEMVSVSQTTDFVAENEFTSFKAEGIAVTGDGREISFNVEANMSRSFMQYTKITEENMHKAPDPIITQTVCDPLVINLKGNVASVSDQKFYFDIDSDGREDSISGLSDGSGFLVLDKNGNGRADNGSELFGTASGDGFKDLAAYDEDGNGWIDENDAVFDRLRIWTRDEEGRDHMLTLKQADVGAVHLGSAATEFTLTDSDSAHADAFIRKTGVYLKESGGAGTVHHVDLAL